MHGVSRHTARAALQIIEAAGLIERRPGLGTIVVSTGGRSAFAQGLGGVDDLMQYAHEARLVTWRSGGRILTVAEAELYRARSGSSWLVLEGARVVAGRSIAATSIFVAEAVGASAADFRDPACAVTEHIERLYGIGIARIEQSIRAEALSTADASSLGVEAKSPGLRTIRRYFDDADRLFVISDSRHPADRFVYEMTFTRRADA